MPDLARAAAVREHAADVGYTAAGVEALLGAEAMTALREHDRAPALWATREPSPLATMVRLFHLGDPVAAADAAAALGDPHSWAALGLIESSGAVVRPALHLRPHAAGGGEDWLLASDLLTDELRADAVMGVGGASQTLAHMTVREPVEAALDLGTGGGIQSLYAARHAAVVRATDRNPRALQIAALNLALNGVANVELREGDLIAPAAGRRYGLIVSNPPFVVSPESSYQFRDSGMPAGELCRRIIEGAPGLLEPGGYCQLLANWGVRRGRTWTAELAEWFDDSPCDIWVLQRDLEDPSAYARVWLREGGPAAANGYEIWMRWYDEHGIEAVGSGIITLRLPGAGGGRHRLMQDIRHEIEVPAGGSVVSQLARLDLLADSTDEVLLRTRLRAASGLVMEQTSTLGGDGWDSSSLRVRQSHGLRWTGEMQPQGATLLAGCDGTRAVVDVLAGVGVQPDVLPAALATVRRLVLEGFLEPA